MPEKNKNEVTYFARTNFRNEQRKFGIKTDDRRRHMYLIGKTGMGKSTLMENMIIQDIRAGKGVGVVDPHGELVEKVLEYIPSHRMNDVMYFNPADLEYPIAFNILENVDVNYKHLVASGLMGVFTKIWENMWSARMEYILNNCILALLDSPGNTLLGINRLLVDKKYRKKIVDKVTDPVVKSFWVDEYANYNDRFRTEAIAPIQNKVGQFLSSAIIRNIVGQPKSTIDMREIMDEKKILLMNLAKGRIGESNSALLGAMMIVRLQLAAMSRIDVPESEREDFYLYVDEFQNFATSSFADILSEARKFRLCLTLAHQYIEQLDELVKAAIFGNVGSLVIFRVGSIDAEELVKEFSPAFTEEDLINLTKYDIYLRLMIDGVASRPFSASTLPPAPDEWKNKSVDKVIAVSRERYAKSRESVEEKIMRWSGLESMYKATAEVESVVDDEKIYGDNGKNQLAAAAKKHKENGKNQKKSDQHKQTEAPPVQPKISSVKSTDSKESDKEETKSTSVDDEKKEALCDNCGEVTHINFVPDAFRNVFCKKCFKLFKKGEINTHTLAKRNVVEVEDSPPGVITPDSFAKSQAAISLDDAMTAKPVSFGSSKKDKITKPRHVEPGEKVEVDG